MKRAIITLCFILSLVIVGCYKYENFDSAEWKEHTESERTSNLRWYMSKDLMKNYQLKGVKKDSIINLLGEPKSKQNDKYQYFLGYTGKGINTGILTIIFEKGIVKELRLTQG